MLPITPKSISLLIGILFMYSHILYSQPEEFKTVKKVHQLFVEKKYEIAERVINNRQINPEITGEEKIQLHLYSGIVYYYLNRIHLAKKDIEEVLRINPELHLNKDVYGNDVVEFIEKIRKEVIGALKITTIPEGADIFINNRKAGISPLYIKHIYSNYIKISAVKEGYGLIEKDVYVFPGETTETKLVMRWENYNGILDIRTSPENATIYINSALIGTSPSFYSGVGKCNIELEKVGYIPETKIVNLEKRKIIRFFQYMREKEDILIYSQLIPGWSQFKLGYPKHGAFFSVLTIAYSIYSFNYSKHNNPYFKKNSELDIHQASFNFDNRMTTIKLVGAAIYLLNCIDTFFIIKRDMRKKIKKAREKFELELKADQQQSRIKLVCRF